MSNEAKYGSDHRKERERWRPIVEAGDAYCVEPECVATTRWIPPSSRWTLSHDPSGTIWLGPSHARCNYREAGVRGQQIRKAEKAEKRRRAALPDVWFKN